MPQEPVVFSEPPGISLFLRNQTCCLTGHRILPPAEQEDVLARLSAHVERLIREEGVRYFGVGGAVGFDMLGAEYLLRLRDTAEKDLRIISVIPWPGWMRTGDWTASLRARQRKILAASDKVVYVRPAWENSLYLLRDRRLVEDSAFCISYCNRPRTGAAYTVRYALRQGVHVLNTCDWDVSQLIKK